jgi:GTP-binding protein
MKVRYIGGCYNPGEFPDVQLPEVAFVGRSNVGKSSLINLLVGQRQLARVSSTPGRTQAIHFFGINDRMTLVDLPGFGFAAAPKSVRKAWKPLIESYLSDRDCLRAVLLLVDIRREPGETEKELAKSLIEAGVRTIVVVTKSDKVAKTRRPSRIQKIGSHLGVPTEDVMAISSLNRDGRTELWDRIQNDLAKW